ncbi:MAG: DegT/DnrJ/EryC1/StrS family aminotransferase, partial [Glaciecola sp.]
QLNRLDEHISARRRCANFYFDKLKELPLILPAPDNEQQSGWHLFMVELSNNDDTDDLKLVLEKRRDIFLRLQEKGVGVNVHYIPIHLHPYYRNLGFNLGDYPNSERFYSRAITLPLYPTLTISDQQRVVDALTDILL